MKVIMLMKQNNPPPPPSSGQAASLNVFLYGFISLFILKKCLMHYDCLFVTDAIVLMFEDTGTM